MSQLNVPFRLIGLSTEQFAIIEENYNEDGEIEMEIGIKHGLDIEKNGFTVLFVLKFIADKKVFLKLEVGGHFNIEMEAWKSFINENETTIVFPKQLIQHLTVITVGTSRGILHAKTENTPMQNLLLPTIDLTKMITKDVSFELITKED